MVSTQHKRGGGSNLDQGHKKILVIPVRFTDAAGPANSDVSGFTGWTALTNGTAQAEINSFFLSQSYGQLSVEFTILPVIDLGSGDMVLHQQSSGHALSQVDGVGFGRDRWRMMPAPRRGRSAADERPVSDV